MQTALAIIVEDHKVLIGKLKQEKVPEYGGIAYAFPSVQTEDAENIRKALVQEVKMQADLEVKIITKIGERSHPATQHVTEYYACEKIREQEVTVSPEADIEEFFWVEPQDITKYMPSLFENVKEYLQRE